MENICNQNFNSELTVAVCLAVASIMTGAAILTVLASYDMTVHTTTKAGIISSSWVRSAATCNTSTKATTTTNL